MAADPCIEFMRVKGRALKDPRRGKSPKRPSTRRLLSPREEKERGKERETRRISGACCGIGFAFCRRASAETKGAKGGERST